MVKAREQLVAAQKQYGESKDVNDVSKIQRCKRYLDTTYDCVQKEFLQEKIDIARVATEIQRTRLAWNTIIEMKSLVGGL